MLFLFAKVNRHRAREEKMLRTLRMAAIAAAATLTAAPAMAQVNLVAHAAGAGTAGGLAATGLVEFAALPIEQFYDSKNRFVSSNKVQRSGRS